MVGGVLTKAGQDVTSIDRLSQRVQQRALAAQALGTLLGEALNAGEDRVRVEMRLGDHLHVDAGLGQLGQHAHQVERRARALGDDVAVAGLARREVADDVQALGRTGPWRRP